MADPLIAFAEREVPKRTNFFDPADAQTVISRYASARRRSEDTGALADSAMKISRAREDADRAARQKVLWDRDDEDYFARKDALAKQGEFLTRLNDIDPESPDYDRMVTEFMTSLPPELHEEPAVKSIFAFKNQVADDARRRRDAEASRQRNYEFWQKKFEKGADFKFKHLTPEDYASNQLQDGSPDFRALQIIENERARGYKEREYNRRVEARVQGRLKILDAADLSKRGRERRGTVDKFIIEDRVAFPRHIDNLVEEYKKSSGKTTVDPALLKDNPKWRDAYASAKAWDTKPLDSELSAAFVYDDPEDYVNLVSGLTESQKERRRMVWEHAHKDGAVEEASGEPTPAPAATVNPNQAALDWLKANPNDPRAAAVRKKLGM